AGGQDRSAAPSRGGRTLGHSISRCPDLARQVPRLFPIAQPLADPLDATGRQQDGEREMSLKYLSRRTMLKIAAGSAATIVAIPAARLFAAAEEDSFIDVRRAPDSVTIVTEKATSSAAKTAADRREAD